MKSNQIKELEDEKFRRLTGVKHPTFIKMVSILKEADGQKKSRGGRKNKLSIEDQLLMALEYIREYRTYFHTSQSYEISESSAYKAIKWIEDKKRNKELASERVLNENVIGMLKRFKIISDKYRNRRKRFGLRFNLISGIYN